MSFEVHVAAVNAASNDMERLSDAVTPIYNVVNNYLQVEPDGNVLSSISGELNGIGDDLRASYTYGGTAQQVFGGAGAALWGIALEYERTDEAQREKYDAQMPKVDGATHDNSHESGSDIYWPVVDVDAHTSEFGKDPADSFDSYNDFIEIGDGVEYVIGFDWIGDVLGGLGLPDPISGFKEELEGDWESVGKAVGALDMVQSWCYDVNSDLGSIVEQLQPTWAGNAADSFYAWVDDFQSKLSDQASDLGGAVSRIKAEAMTIKGLVDEFVDVIDTIVGMLPDPSDLGSILGLLGSAAKLAGKILGWIELAKSIFDLALTACMGIVAGFAQLTRIGEDTNFPTVPDWERPHADGSS